MKRQIMCWRMVRSFPVIKGASLAVSCDRAANVLHAI